MKTPVSKYNTGWLTTYLLQRGISTDDIITGGNLPVDTHLVTLKRLPFVSYLKLFNWAADHLNNDNLGLNLVDSIEPEDLLPVGLGSYKFCNLRELLQALHQFNKLITQGIDIVYKESELTSILTYRGL